MHASFFQLGYGEMDLEFGRFFALPMQVTD